MLTSSVIYAKCLKHILNLRWLSDFSTLPRLTSEFHFLYSSSATSQSSHHRLRLCWLLFCWLHFYQEPQGKFTPEGPELKLICCSEDSGARSPFPYSRGAKNIPTIDQNIQLICANREANTFQTAINKKSSCYLHLIAARLVACSSSRVHQAALSDKKCDKPANLPHHQTATAGRHTLLLLLLHCATQKVQFWSTGVTSDLRSDLSPAVLDESSEFSC